MSEKRGVEIDNLCFSYNLKNAKNFEVHAEKFRLAPGEIVYLSGPSGAGKTTLFGVATGAMESELSNEFRRVFPCMAYVMHKTCLIPWLSVQQNFERESKLRKIEVRLERFLQILDKFGLDHEIKHKKGGELSLGMQQRVEIARALAFRPDLLVLDEGMSGIDQATKSKVFKILRQEVEDFQLCVLGTTHYLTDLMRLVDRIYPVQDGQIGSDVCLKDSSLNRISVSDAELFANADIQTAIDRLNLGMSHREPSIS